MSWHYLREQEAGFSVENYLDGIRSERLKSKNTPEKYYCNDKEMESLNPSRYGMILQHLTVNHGKGVLISFPGGSLVKTFQQQEKEKGLKDQDQDSGKSLQGSLTKYDHNSASWKTAQCSLLGDLEPFSETWPKWGTMLDGVCWELMTPERLTEEREYGYWATPLCMDSLPPKSEKALMNEATNARPGRSKPANLRDQVHPEQMEKWNGGIPIRQTYPTPTNSMMTYADMEQARFAGNSQDRPKYQDVKYIPGSTKEDPKEKLGQLNPLWVEWLMGWPIGWTDLKPLETDKFQQWQQQHLLFLAKD